MLGELGVSEMRVISQAGKVERPVISRRYGIVAAGFATQPKSWWMSSDLLIRNQCPFDRDEMLRVEYPTKVFQSFRLLTFQPQPG